MINFKFDLNYFSRCPLSQDLKAGSNPCRFWRWLVILGLILLLLVFAGEIFIMFWLAPKTPDELSPGFDQATKDKASRKQVDYLVSTLQSRAEHYNQIASSTPVSASSTTLVDPSR